MPNTKDAPPKTKYTFPNYIFTFTNTCKKYKIPNIHSQVTNTSYKIPNTHFLITNIYSKIFKNIYTLQNIKNYSQIPNLCPQIPKSGFLFAAQVS